MKTVLITGASGGIGSCIAQKLSACGYYVIAGYHRSKEKALQLKRDMEEKGGTAMLVQADVSQRDQVETMFEEIEKQVGSVDILVNNAGISSQMLITDVSPAHWNQMWGVNVNGALFCTQRVLPGMISKKQGKIINISSIWGMVGASCEVHYSTTKAAMIGFTKALAKEVGPSGIQVNCVAPGVIETQMLRDLSPEDLEALKEETPLGVLGQGEDVASCVAFLASKEANFMTGQVISPNGGLVI